VEYQRQGIFAHIGQELMTKAERQHYDKLSQIGCIVCHRQGLGYTLPHIHHIRHGVGMAQRSHYLLAIPLCPNHHQNGGHGTALHAGQKTFEAKYGTETELLEHTTKILKGEI
jgi:hypothetical protein